MSYLMQPYLNQRTMVLRSALVDNTATSWSVTGDGTTNTFEQAGTSQWWGNSQKDYDLQGSGVLRGESMIKRFRLNQEEDAETEGAILIDFDIKLKYVWPVEFLYRYNLELIINDNYTVNLRSEQHSIGKGPASGQTDTGISWQKNYDYKINGDYLGYVKQLTSNYTISIPYEVAYDTKYKDPHQNDLIKVNLESTREDGSPKKFMLDNFVIAEKIINHDITDVFSTDEFHAQFHSGWNGGEIKLFGDTEKMANLVIGKDVGSNKTFQRTVSVNEQGDVTSDGVIINFEMYELDDSNPNDTFYISINGITIPLGNFFSEHNFEDHIDRERDGIQWKRYDSESNHLQGSDPNIIDQQHGFKIFVSNKFLDENLVDNQENKVKIEFSTNSPDELDNDDFNEKTVAISNFNIKNGTLDGNDLDDFFVSTAEIGGLNAALEKLGNGIDINFSEELESTIANFMNIKIDDFNDEIKSIHSTLKGRSLERFTDQNIQDLVENANKGFDNAIADFENIASVYWQVLFHEGDPDGYDTSFVNLLTTAISFATSLSSATSADGIVNRAAVIGANAVLVNSLVNAGADMKLDLEEITDLSVIADVENFSDVLQKILAEADVRAPESENDSGGGLRSLVNEYKVKLYDLQEAVVSMAANLHLAAAIHEWKTKSYHFGQDGMYKDEDMESGLKIFDNAGIESLGFSVVEEYLGENPQYNEYDRYKMTIRSDDVSMLLPDGSDELSYRYQEHTWIDKYHFKNFMPDDNYFQ